MDQNTLQALLKEAVREVVAEVLQTLMELDREAFLRENGGRKNGYYRRRLETSFGLVSLKVPRDREGRYYPGFLTPYTRRLVDVGEVAVALYAAGVSQRKAAEVISLLLGHRYTHETISAITDGVLERVQAFRQRPLPEELAFVYLDGFFLKVHREGQGVEREAVYVALGVTPSGERQILGFWLWPTESAPLWQGVLQELWARGLQRVLLFITDGLRGIEEAIRRVYPLADWQRCVVHLLRQSGGQVRARERGLVLEELRGVYLARDKGEALQALERFKGRWGGRYPSLVAAWWENAGAGHEVLRLPRGAVAVPEGHESNGAVYPGGAAGHRFPRPEAVEKLVYLVAEGEEWKWGERRLKGFAGVQEELQRRLDQRYAPQTQTLTHKS